MLASALMKVPPGTRRRRYLGYDVQYFAAVEPQRRLAPTSTSPCAAPCPAPSGIRLRCRGWLDLHAGPRLADGRRSGPSAVTAANTAAKPLDNACPVRTTLECRPSTRTTTDGPGRYAYSYGSEGWGFESLRARHD
jgi:hypothetical protein